MYTNVKKMYNAYMDIKKYIHQSNLIENIDDKAYDKQSLLAWNWLKKQEELTFGVVCKLQKMITLLQDDLMPHQRGYTRSTSKVNVYIGDKTAPAWWLVDGMLDNWLLDMKEYWQTLDPIEMHIRYEKCHPWVDGNGRSGRMLLWHHELRLGHIPTLFMNSKKHEEYYPLFR